MSRGNINFHHRLKGQCDGRWACSYVQHSVWSHFILYIFIYKAWATFVWSCLHIYIYPVIISDVHDLPLSPLPSVHSSIWKAVPFCIVQANSFLQFFLSLQIYRLFYSFSLLDLFYLFPSGCSSIYILKLSPLSFLSYCIFSQILSGFQISRKSRSTIYQQRYNEMTLRENILCSLLRDGNLYNTLLSDVFECGWQHDSW